ncbi:MAG: hypothetical protein VB032_08740 [Burkholderiaceae bacterium]|nr:hypothetical protein [Burkholderiaceae bacterium]
MKPTIPETIPEYDETRIIERPDGFYWQFKDGDEEFGPFATLLEAVQDMQYHDNGSTEPGETLEEAESEIGISDWVDSDTGLPAEENVPRLEEH